MKTILQHQHSRRKFLIIVVIALVSILLIRIFALPYFETPIPKEAIACSLPKDPTWLTVTTRIFDSLFVSLLVSVFVSLFIFFIEEPEESKKFEIIEGFKIKEIFKTARNTTEIWFFSGGTGRYTRTVTLKELSEIARQANSHKVIKLQLLDPSNLDLCKAYATYRRSLRSAAKNNGSWNTQTVIHETVATIVAAILYKSDNPLLDITIDLKNNFSTLRIDLSTDIAVITKEDDQEPALVCKPTSFLYRSYKEEILQTSKQYPSLNTAIDFDKRLDEIENEDVLNIVGDLKLNVNLSTEDLSAISKLLRENKNPYA